jgi:hypothetical protein
MVRSRSTCWFNGGDFVESVRPPPSLLHPSHTLVPVSRSRSMAPYPPSPLRLAPSLPSPFPLLPSPSSLLPLFQVGVGREGRGGGRSPRGGGSFIRKPASPLSLLSLPSFLYLFILPTPFIRARTCTPPPPRCSRSRRGQHLPQKLLNPKLPQLMQGRRRRRDGEEDVFGVRR